jgi:hypothetical protein
MAEEMKVPATEEPAFIKQFRWAVRFISDEAAVIRGAKFSIAIMVIAIGVLVYFVLEGYHAREQKIKDATIQFQGEQLAEFRNKLQVKTPDEAAHKISVLEKKLKPILDDLDRPQRTLKDEQKRRLILNFESLKARIADSWIWVSSSEDRESQFYALDIARAFRNAGLRVASAGAGFAETDDYGLIVELPDPEHPSELAKLILENISKSGISFRTRVQSNDYPNPPDMELLVTREHS